MVDVVELIREARVIIGLGADDVAVSLRVDFDAGTRKLVEDAANVRQRSPSKVRTSST